MTHSYRAVLALFVLSLIVSSSTFTVFAQSGDTDPTGAAPQSCVAIPQDVRYRDTDATTNGAISMVQEFLISKGYMNSEATGYFGSVTFASVKKYQASKGLTTSGFVGQYTRLAIKADSCSSNSTIGTTSQNTSTTTNTTTTTSTNRPTPITEPVGIISVDNSSKGCFVILGKNTCTVTVKWATVDYLTTPKPAALTSCEANASGACATTEERYEGEKGSQQFQLGYGLRRMFAIWGYDYLGKLYKADQLTLKGECASGSTWNGTSCATSSAGSNQFTGFVVGPGPSFGPGSSAGVYSWYAYAGSMLLIQTPENLGFAKPTIPCDAGHIGATYFLGTGRVDGKPIVAQCLAPGQGLTDFVALTSSTLNHSGTTTTSASASPFVVGPGNGTNGNVVTYTWSVNLGSVNAGAYGVISAWLSPKDLGFPEPSTPCAANTVGKTYYLGVYQGNGPMGHIYNVDGRDVVAGCYSSAQTGAEQLPPTMTSSTLNKPGTTTAVTATTTTTTTSCSGNGPLVWGNGSCSGNYSGTVSSGQSATLDNSKQGYTGSITYSCTNGAWAYVSETCNATAVTPPVNSCTWDTHLSGDGTFTWACGSASCTGAPAGSGWVDQKNGCYHQPATPVTAPAPAYTPYDPATQNP